MSGAWHPSICNTDLCEPAHEVLKSAYKGFPNKNSKAAWSKNSKHCTIPHVFTITCQNSDRKKKWFTKFFK